MTKSLLLCLWTFKNVICIIIILTSSLSAFSRKISKKEYEKIGYVLLYWEQNEEYFEKLASLVGVSNDEMSYRMSRKLDVLKHQKGAIKVQLNSDLIHLSQIHQEIILLSDLIGDVPELIKLRYLLIRDIQLAEHLRNFSSTTYHYGLFFRCIWYKHAIISLRIKWLGDQLDSGRMEANQITYELLWAMHELYSYYTSGVIDQTRRKRLDEEFNLVEKLLLLSNKIDGSGVDKIRGMAFSLIDLSEKELNRAILKIRPDGFSIFRQLLLSREENGAKKNKEIGQSSKSLDVFREIVHDNECGR